MGPSGRPRPPTQPPPFTLCPSLTPSRHHRTPTRSRPVPTTVTFCRTSVSNLVTPSTKHQPGGVRRQQGSDVDHQPTHYYQAGLRPVTDPEGGTTTRLTRTPGVTDRRDGGCVSHRAPPRVRSPELPVPPNRSGLTEGLRFSPPCRPRPSSGELECTGVPNLSRLVLPVERAGPYWGVVHLEFIEPTLPPRLPYLPPPVWDAVVGWGRLAVPVQRSAGLGGEGGDILPHYH